MPIISIPEKEMVIRFPDDMSDEEVERAIYTHVYGQPVLSEEREPSLVERGRQFVGDLFRRLEPGVGPLREKEKDREAFKPSGGLTLSDLRVFGEREEEIDPEILDIADDIDASTPSTEKRSPQDTIKQYASYAPYLAVRAVHGLTFPILPPLKAIGVDTEGLLKTATDYWRRQVGDTVQIPNVGVGLDEKGGLRLEPREPIPFADLLGQTAEIAGAVTGPVRAALGAGGLVAEKLGRYARPFFRSIVRGMIGGALLGEGKKDETLQNMALFGTFEPIAYGIGKASKVPQAIKDSTVWRKMSIRERGLILQSFDDAIKNNPNITEGEILRKWNNPTWRQDAIKFREEAIAKRRVGEVKPEERVAERVKEEPKQPWEMTYKEHGEKVYREYEKKGVGAPPMGAFEEHEHIIKQALSEGKPIPRYVLGEYKGQKWADEALGEPTPTKKEAKARPFGKLTILKDKKKILTEIDEAIKKAPDETPEEGPDKFVKFETDGGANILNNKSSLREFRRRISRTAEGEKLTVKPTKVYTKPSPVAAKREIIDELVPIRNNKGWFTDGHLAIKGEPPAKKKYATAWGEKGVDFQRIKEVIDVKTQPTELQYYYVRDLDLGTSISKTPVPKLGEEEPHVLFKVGNKYVAYVQGIFNAIRNRFPDAEYRINTANGSLLAYKDKKPVAVLMPMKVSEGKTPWFFEKEPPLKKEAIEAGFLKEEKRIKLTPGTHKGLYGNFILQDKQGITYEGDVGEHMQLAHHFKLKPEDIAKFGIIEESGRYKWKTTIPDRVKPWKDILKTRDRAEPEAIGESVYSAAKSLADTGGYATMKHRIVEMPEIVRLANALLKGAYPTIKQKLRKKLALGTFRAKGKGKIELKAEIFKDADEAAAVLAHEIGHLVDYLPDKDLGRGNILGRIATLKRYMAQTLPRQPGGLPALTEKDRQRLRRIAGKLIKEEYADKWVDEEIRKELPITPEDVLAIWNYVEQAKLINPDLYEYVARLNTPEKKSIVKEALKGQVPEQLKTFAKFVTEKTGKKIKVEPTPELIRKKYQELLNKEIEKRRAFHLTEVTDELKSLSRTWKPFDPAADPKYTAYRYSSKELYADTFSALINAPGLVRAQAPLFYEGFFNYLEKNPQVKSLYDQIQDDIKSGEVQKERVKNLREMFRKGDDAYAKSLQRHRRFKDLLVREFIDANWFLLKKIRKLNERNIPAGENPRYRLEEMAYSGSETELYLVTVFRNVIKALEKHNLTWDDFGEYLYHKRVSTERAEIANPQGWTAKLSEKRIKEIRDTLKPAQLKALDNAVATFRKLRVENVINKTEKAELYDDLLVKLFKDSVNYATFDVIKYIEKRYGAMPGAKIYEQVGVLGEISNPATATVMKDISVIKATNRHVAARSVSEFLQKHYPKAIRPAERHWNGKFLEIVDPPRGSDEGLIIYLEKGEAKGFYVDKYIAQIFQHNPVESQVIAKILGSTIQPFRLMFTELNYGFWMFNIHRDFFRAAKMLPRASIAKFLRYYLKGIKPAFKSVFGIPEDVISEMQKKNMLISIADVRGLRPEDKQIERLLRMYHIKQGKWNNAVLRPIGKMFTWFTNIGRAWERTTKVGAYKYMKAKFPDMTTSEIGHIVRVMGGSPDFLRLGRGYPIYNNILMFSNAMKEGYRGDYEAFSKRPAEFIWKQAKYTYIPKLLMLAGSMGLLGAGIKKIYDGASEYDKTNYLIIPLGLTESGKSVYYRLPLDETSRFMGGILWKAMKEQKTKMLTGLFDYMSGQAPTIHPGVDNLIAIIQYCSGLNPYDHFRGRYVIPEQVFEAGGKRSHQMFLKWLANKSGGSLLYRFRYDDVDRIKTELEKVTGYPVASNILGRFIKVTNQGLKEELREVKRKVRAESIRAILDAKDAISKWIRGEPLNNEEIQAILAKPDIIDRNMMVGLSRKYGAVYLEGFLTATSNKEKAAVLEKMLQRYEEPSEPQEKPAKKSGLLFRLMRAIGE